ncbi:MAG: protein-tyrosine-phosphatase [Acetobacteraceae bacterium]|nr:protein-tyrosine-phosphatase [Acetobacteraceae bacterium]
MVLPFRITVCGLEELDGHCASAVSHVLSIMDPGWPVPAVFDNFGEHARLELRFHDVIEDVPGMQGPTQAHVEALLGFGRTLAPEPTPHLLVHCHAGVSRSSASMALLIAQAAPELPGSHIFEEIMRVRSGIWPNLRIVEIGDRLLLRRGDLVAGAIEVYRQQIAKAPGLVQQFEGGGRGREVRAAGF